MKASDIAIPPHTSDDPVLTLEDIYEPGSESSSAFTQSEEEESDGEGMVDLDGNDIVEIPKLAIPQLDHDDRIIIP